ncbi:uncharacterized protein [Venturia canescens]|uniref:uncharacterized protein n=1 Tax=Venturia canescens TaxID=32260 RepID=UPI001C9CA55C|nr:uncharacterized protein LOC122410681 [Venturia canescens]
MRRRNFRDYFHFNEVLLKLTGLLPFKLGYDCLALSISIITIFACIFVFGPGFWALIFRWNNITPPEIIAIVREENVYVVSAIKACILILKRHELYRLTESCEKLWRHVETERDLVIVEGYAKRGLYLSYGFAANCFVGVSSCLITPLFESFVLNENGTVIKSIVLPYSAGMFHENVKQFYIWYAFQVPTACHSVLAMVAIDTGLSFYVLHACAHMRLCQEFFQRINEDSTLGKDLELDEIEWNKRKQNFFRHVVKSVSFHKEVLRYSDDLEKIYAPVILIQTLQGVVAICGYSFGTLLGEETERPRSAACVLAVTFQLLLLCWPPDALQDESMKVADAAYDLPWYDWTKKEGKLVCMIIAKSQRPVLLTAKQFAIISLLTFTFNLQKDKFERSTWNMLATVFILFPKRKKHYALLKSCERLWRHVECERDLAIVEEYAEQKLQVMYIYLSCAFGIVMCFLTAPLFTSFVVAANGTVLISKSLPWSTGIFHDNVMKFYIWYALQVPATLSAIIGIAAINTAPLFYVMHAGIHMRLCQKNFESVTEKTMFEKPLTRNNSTWNVMRNKFFQHVVSGIVYHSEILQYSKDVEETFQSIIFAEIFTALVTTGGYCFLSQVVAKKDLPKMAFCMSGLVVQMFILCWPPDSLRDESFKISHAAYNLDWYEWTRQEGKLIYIIIEKSQKPLVITANKMVVISLETFGWVR